MFKAFERRRLRQKVDETDNLFDYSYHQSGSIPGTLRIKPHAEVPQIDAIDYTAEIAIRSRNLRPIDCQEYLQTSSISWVDVAGLGDAETFKALGAVFDLHPLLLEDIVNVPQRPKLANYADRLAIITQMAIAKPDRNGFWLEQVSLIIGKNYVLSVQEEADFDCFNPVRDRILQNQGIIRQKNADYLAYALWDAIIDGYFPILEDYGERIEILEDEVIINPTDITLDKIYQIRRELLALRRAMWPQRDAINSLLRDRYPLISDDVRLYLRDCYDRTVQIIDITETYRELASGLMDVYLSAVSNKMNEIMKVLTVISTIFIPLTFIVGVYGMNFNPDASPWNMPELNWYWGYPVFWGLTLVIAFGLIYFFWKRGWFKNTTTTRKR
jgi:magnesium transporter